MITKSIDKTVWTRRLLMVGALVALGLLLFSGFGQVEPASANVPVSLIESSLVHQVLDHTVTGPDHDLLSYVVPAGTNRVLVVAAAIGIEHDVWRDATYNGTEMTYVVAHHDGYGTGISMWMLPLGTSVVDEPAADINLSHFSGSVLLTDIEFISVAVFENVNQDDHYAPSVPEPPVPGARRFGLAVDGHLVEPSVPLNVPSTTGDMIYAIYAAYNDIDSGFPAINPTGSQTIRHSASLATDPAGGYPADFTWMTTTQPGASASDSVTFNDAPVAWVYGAVNLRAAPAPPAQVDISVSKSESIDPVAPGTGSGNLTHVTTVTNNGPDGATALVMNEAIETPNVGVTIDSITASDGSHDLPLEGGPGQWAIGDLASGASATLTIVYTVDAAAVDGTDVITSSASLNTVTEPDVDGSNNAASVATSISSAEQPASCDVNSGFNVIMGTEGADTLIGTEGNDIIMGLGGADVIQGLGGNDCLIGDSGNDTILGGQGEDIIFGNDGDDYVKGNGGADSIDGGNNNDTLLGGNGADVIFGRDGDDIINGNGGADVISGNQGEDTILGGNGNDTLNGNRDNDFINGNSGTDTINGGNQSDLCINGESLSNCEGP
ncbi:MAG: hypothetical protein AAF614_27030 [Chloroflexota bacterium]